MDETEPGEILEDRRLVFGLRSLAIVILDAQQHAPVAGVGDAPDMQGIDDMPKVQVAGGRRRKACQHVQ